MALSVGEKLIITLLCDLLKHLNINRELDPEFIQKTLFDDHEWALEWNYPGLFTNNEIPTPDTVYTVANILDMWSMIEASYDEYTESQMEQVREEASPFGNNPKFRGFDGNNETELYSIARFLIGPLQRWDEFKDRDMNSHAPLLPAYERMLAVYGPLTDRFREDPLLTPAELIKVLNAQAYREEE